MPPKVPKKPRRDIGFYLFILALLVVAIAIISNVGSGNGIGRAEVEYYEVRQQFMNRNVESFEISGTKLTMKLRTADPNHSNATELTHALYSVQLFLDDNREYITEALDKSSPYHIENFKYTLDESFTSSVWFSFIPYVIMIIVIIFLFNMMISRSVGSGADRGAARFSRARTRLASENKKRVTFNDVAGAEEEKQELQEIVDFLKNPAKYERIGARIPKGVLLVGPPGTGKTLIAKAVAGEAGVEFLSISGSDFVELYVGVGASRVRDLFDQAKKLSPSIIFIDEIDAVGRQRGAGLGGGHDEREQTLNQLLVEMDGFNANEGVIIIAATNRSDILDSALLRPGRFDRQVYVGLPDIKGREEILKVHSRDKKFADDVKLSDVAKSTTGFTGADLENLLNESALQAARADKPVITMEDIDRATLKVMAGPEKKTKVVTEHERKLTAYHEAGHAVTAFFLKHSDPVHHISIIPRGQTGGVTVTRPEEDKSFQSKSEMFDRIVLSLGGRISEQLFLDDISTGASGDIQTASRIARAMVMTYGMSDEIGPISFDDSSHSVFIGRDFSQTKSYSEKTAAAIDDAVHSIFQSAMTACTDLLNEHSDIVEATAAYLIKYESMDGEKFKNLVEYGVSHRGMEPSEEEAADEPAPESAE